MAESEAGRRSAQRDSQGLSDVFALLENEGPDKVMSLEQAVRLHVRPAMAIYSELEAEALLHEILRQFLGTTPEFTLIAFQLSGTGALALVHEGLVRRLVFSNCSDIFPTPRPSPVIQRAIMGKLLNLENWSVLSLQLRLLAGALGVSLMPTKALVSTDVAVDNRDSFKVIDDPFGHGKPLGVVKALSPDLALVHAWAADQYGNTITNSWASNFDSWGPKASGQGVIVTVEHLVSTEFIREHAHLVRIPGCIVQTVSVVPFGAHPQAMPNIGLPEFEGYGLDGDFLAKFQRSCNDSQSFDEWIDEWVLTPQSRDDYLSKLGAQRLFALRGKTSRDAWKDELLNTATIDTERRHNGLEMMVVAAARKIVSRVVANSYQTLFAGIGFSGLSGWLAYYVLQKSGRLIDLIGAGIGFSPRPGDPYLLNPANIGTSRMICGLLDMHGNCVSGENNHCLGVIGAGQIDRSGAVNTSWITDDIFLSGVGGGNDIATGSREVIAVVPQSKRRLCDRVSYISHPGERITTLVTNMAVFEKRDADDFILTEYIPNPKFSTLDDHVKAIQDECGWGLKLADGLLAVAPAEPYELAILRALDPRGDFVGLG